MFVGVDDNALLVDVLFTGNSGPMVAFDGTRVPDKVALGDNVDLSETISGCKPLSEEDWIVARWNAESINRPYTFPLT